MGRKTVHFFEAKTFKLDRIPAAKILGAASGEIELREAS